MATAHQIAHYATMAAAAQALAAEAAAARPLWSDLPGIIRRLGMPFANEDLQHVICALSSVVASSGLIDAENAVQCLDEASDAVLALRDPGFCQDADADEDYPGGIFGEVRDDDRRAGL